MTSYMDKLNKAVAAKQRNLGLKIRSFSPSVLIITAFISLAFILGGFLLDRSNSSLLQSEAFMDIVKCTDRFDGVQCFNHQKMQLVKEAKQYGMTDNALHYMVNCFSTATTNANDLALLLNVQNCYHKADSIQMYQLIKTPRIPMKWLIAITVYLCWRLLILSWQLINSVFLRRETEELKESIDHCNIIQNSLLYKCSSLKSAVDSLNSKTSGNVNKRYTRTYKRDLENQYARAQRQEYDNYLCLQSPLFYSPREISNAKLAKPLTQLPSKLQLSKKEPLISNKPVVAQVGGQKFDLSDKEGIAKWKDFCQGSTSPSSPTKLSAKTATSLETLKNGTKINLVDTIELDSSSKTNKELDKEQSAGPKPLSVNVIRTDKNGKPYRRLFIPGQGWTSAKKVMNQENTA